MAVPASSSRPRAAALPVVEARLPEPGLRRAFLAALGAALVGCTSGPPSGQAGGGRAPAPGATTRGVVRPPEGMDPGIHATVPVPRPGTTLVIPPPGTPGGDPWIEPR